MDNEQTSPEPTRPPGLPSRPELWRRNLGGAVLALILFAGVFECVRRNLGDGAADTDGSVKSASLQLLESIEQPTSDQAATAPKLFEGWTKPDFVLILSGQAFGYLQPCGCSHPQYGGLARRWELLNDLRKKGWTLIPVDVGDLFPKGSDLPAAQNLLKYETTMRALHIMGYHAVGIGKHELEVPLRDALGQYSLNNPRPRALAANLVGIEEDGIYNKLGARPFHVVEVMGLPKIGVIAAIGKSVQELFKDEYKFSPDQVTAALKALQKQTEFNVMLFQTDDRIPSTQGRPSEVERCVKWCNDHELAKINVVLHSTDQPEPPFVPVVLGDTQIFNIGHKGKYVGVLGVWRKKDGGYEYKYQPILIGPEYEPQPGNPVAQLMEDYAERVKKNNLMARFTLSTHKTQALIKGAKYVGSEICGNCHQDAHNIWQANNGNALAHSRAFKTLEDAKNPSLRQFDGECVQCHTTGFKHPTGYNDPAIKPKMKNLLLNVGCESCHGPASAHVNNSSDMDARKLLNPWSKKFNPGMPEQKRLLTIDIMCQKCHDLENDVHWDFNKAWPKVIHMNPPAKPPAKENSKK